MSESIDQLVERVRYALRETSYEPLEALAALTELAERVQTTEDMNRALHADLAAAYERVKAAEADRQVQYDAAMAAIEGRAAAERERDLAHIAIGEHEETYMRMEAFFRAQRDELVEALEASDGLIRMLRPDLSHTRPRADEIVKRNAAALAKINNDEDEFLPIGHPTC